MNTLHKTGKSTVNEQRRAVIRLGAAGLATVAVASAVPGVAYAAKSLIYTGRFNNKAVGGYDPVAYFTEGKPVKGTKQHSLNYQGAQWFFANQANLDLFEADPDKYAPQYGGYCAYAVGIGQTAKGNPKNWDIVDGKLYLNYNGKFQKIWKNDQASYIERGDANWPNVIK